MALAEVVRRADGDPGEPARIIVEKAVVGPPGQQGAGVAVLRRFEGLELLEEVGKKDQYRPARAAVGAPISGARAAGPLEGSGTQCVAVGPREPDVVDVGCRGDCLGRYAAVFAA